MGRNVVVIGTQWGDEGKGAVVDVLADRAQRRRAFSGWAQRRAHARHRRPENRPASDSVRHPARRRVCLIGNGVVVSLDALCKEMDELAAQGRARRAAAARVAGVPDHLELASRCSIGRASRRAAPPPSARRAAASARPMKTRLRGARSASRICSRRARSKRSSSGCSICTTSCSSELLPHRARGPAAASSTNLLRLGERVKPLVVDVTELLRDLHATRRQRAVRGRTGCDARHRPRHVSIRDVVEHDGRRRRRGHRRRPGAIDYVLGIVKAYTTRVGAGPFPTELSDDIGRHLAQGRREFGSTTGRPRRCGWFDAVLLKRAVFTNSLAGLCLTKLDVLDGLPEIKICVGYRLDGKVLDTPPLLIDRFGGVRAGLRDRARLERRRRPGRRPTTRCRRRRKDYLRRIEELAGVPIDIVSTGPSRDAVIMRRPSV